MSATGGSLSCLEFEERLLEYREGVLPAADAAAVRRHRQECAACAVLLNAVSELTLDLGDLPMLAPPAHLLTAIVARTLPPPAPARLWAPAWAPAWAGGGRGPAGYAWSRMAMAFGMTLFALALVLNAANVNLRQFGQAGGWEQLQPASLGATLQRSAARAWARGVSYYQDLRVVYEIEAAVHQMRQAPPPGSPAGSLQEPTLYPHELLPSS